MTTEEEEESSGGAAETFCAGLPGWMRGWRDGGVEGWTPVTVGTTEWLLLLQLLELDSFIYLFIFFHQL